jgi:hypothetical protein
MLKKLLLILGAGLAILMVVIAMQPATFKVERSTVIAAPPDVVLAQIDDFHRWAAWSPWEKLDPNMKRTFEGPASGIGAMYSWTGNSDVGSGKMTITGYEQAKKLDIKLEFLEPMAATNTTEFITAADAGGTKLSWVMNGNHNFMGKAFGLFMDLDTMIGKDFDNGLAALKTVAEAEAKKKAEEAAAQASAGTATATAAVAQ